MKNPYADLTPVWTWLVEVDYLWKIKPLSVNVGSVYTLALQHDSTQSVDLA